MSQAAVVLVTGGSRGIGAAVVRQLAAQGVAVMFSYRREAAAAQALVAEVQAAGGLARAVPADVADETQVLAMFAALDAWCAELGRGFTGLVNNAGVLETQCKLVDMDTGRWERVLRANVIGSFLCAREAVRRMARSAGGAGGAIVNLSSRASQAGCGLRVCGLRRLQGRGGCDDAGPVARGGRRRHPRQRGGAGPDSHRHPRQRRPTRPGGTAVVGRSDGAGR